MLVGPDEPIAWTTGDALDPTVQAAAAAARAGTELQDEFDVTKGSDFCWIDYAIKAKKR